MSTDRLLTILAVIIGLPSFFALFFSDTLRVEGALCALLIIGVLLVRWAHIQDEKKPLFTALELRLTTTITTVDGRSARYERFERMRANYKGITEWWNRNINQDGTISGLLIDNKPPDMTETTNGTTSVCKRFSRPLEKDEEVAITMAYDLHDSFMRAKESVIHNCIAKRKEVVIVVELPKPCTKAELRQTYGGEHGKLLAAPQVTKEGRRIEVTIKKPLLGASYHVEWSW